MHARRHTNPHDKISSHDLGFYDIAPYFDSPLPNELFLELDLEQLQGTSYKAQG